MDYYCSTKFTDLQIHVPSRLLYNCCKAYPERVSVEWLEKNPGRLFNTDTMLKDRELMLENKSCSSCEFGCYKYERQGGVSARITTKHNDFINNPTADLKNLQISLSTDCNLTCAYCGPEWSTGWHTDITKNGSYKIKDTNLETTNWSKLWSRMKQKTRSTDTKFFNLILREISLAKNLESISLLGGEPLLHNKTLDLLNHLNNHKVLITSGLGVHTERLKLFLQNLKNQKVIFLISAESTGNFFEFLRYGITWKDFLERINIIQDYGIEIRFISTISNISLFDFLKFYNMFGHKHIISINTLSDRPWMMPHVIDEKSKQKFIADVRNYKNNQFFTPILKSLNVELQKQDKDNLVNFLTQFSYRRKINMDFLPKNFLDWCKF
jgi:organic radical activating enzyme